MRKAIRTFVRQRAQDRCEYCGLAQDDVSHLPFQIEHVTAKQHLGSNDPDNLALACERCNQHKGTNLSAIDPETGRVVPLFNPRLQRWSDHFRIAGYRVVGLTEVGRAAVRLLQMNSDSRVNLRKDIEENKSP
jgi:hypothetical protein